MCFHQHHHDDGDYVCNYQIQFIIFFRSTAVATVANQQMSGMSFPGL